MVKAALEHSGQIFGEQLTLLETGKRTPRDAMQLCYPDSDGTHRPVQVPENMVLIGTMNIADRSSALVNMACRWRFAFIDLEPCLGETWREWVVTRLQMDLAAAASIKQRLGKVFQIGHSCITPTRSLEGSSRCDWFAVLPPRRGSVPAARIHAVGGALDPVAAAGAADRSDPLGSGAAMRTGQGGLRQVGAGAGQGLQLHNHAEQSQAFLA